MSDGATMSPHTCVHEQRDRHLAESINRDPQSEIEIQDHSVGLEVCTSQSFRSAVSVCIYTSCASTVHYNVDAQSHTDMRMHSSSHTHVNVYRLDKEDKEFYESETNRLILMSTMLTLMAVSAQFLFEPRPNKDVTTYLLGILFYVGLPSRTHHQSMRTLHESELHAFVSFRMDTLCMNTLTSASRMQAYSTIHPAVQGVDWLDWLSSNVDVIME